MPDKDKDKIGETTLDNPEESTAEMEIIKDVFGGGDAAPAAGGDNVFSTDLFSESAAPAPPPAPEPKAPPAAPAKSAPAKTTGETTAPGKSAPGKSSPGKSAPAAKEAAKAPIEAPPPAPEKEAPAPAEKKGQPIKVVTDDDLRALFDQSSPGLSPEEIGGAPKTAEPAPEESPEEAPAESEVMSRPGIIAEEMEVLDLDAGPSAGPPPAPEPPSPPSAPEASAEDVVEEIETRAKVGEMTVAPAAKKGDALQKTAQALSGLSPIGDDFMSIDELKKLFNNVSVLTQWAQEAQERMEKIERRLDELLKSKGNK
jgi:hypothetical protein